MHNLNNSVAAHIFLLTIVGTLGAAVMVTGVKFLSDELNIFVISFFRCLFGLLIILPYIIHKNIKSLKTTNFKLHLLRSFINCISMLCWFKAISLMPIEKATALGFTTPLFATLLAIIFLKEKIKIHRTIALLIGFFGIIIIIRPGHIDVGLGSYLMISASLSWAFVLIIIKQLSKKDSSFIIIFYMLIIMTPIMLFIALPVWKTPSIKELIIFFGMGLGGLIAHICLVQSLKIAETTLVMPFQYLKLIWASLIGFIIFSENPDLWTWLGGTIIFIAVIYITYRENIFKKNSKENIIITRPSIDE